MHGKVWKPMILCRSSEIGSKCLNHRLNGPEAQMVLCSVLISVIKIGHGKSCN